MRQKCFWSDDHVLADETCVASLLSDDLVKGNLRKKAVEYGQYMAFVL